MAWMLCFSIGVMTLNWVSTLLVLELKPALTAIICCLILLSTYSVWVLKPSNLNVLFKSIVFLKYISKTRKLLIVTLSLLLGMVYGQLQAKQSWLHKLAPKLDRSEYLVTGVIAEVFPAPIQNVLANKPRKESFLFLVEDIQPVLINGFSDSSEKRSVGTLPKRLRLSYYGEESFIAGEKLSMQVQLRAPRSFANPGSFDAIKRMYSQRIDAYGYVKHKQPFYRLGYEPLPITRQLRQNRIAALSTTFTALSNGPVLYALLLGDKSRLSEAYKTRLANTGTSHLMAISGLHISIAAAMGIVIGRLFIQCYPKLLLRIPQLEIEALCSIPLAVLYAILTGLSIPTQRALIMLLSVVAVRLLRREVSIWNYMVIALFAVLLIDPLAVLDTGFWFSFSAVALLIYGFSQSSAIHQNKENSMVLEKPKHLYNVKDIALLQKLVQFFKTLLKTQWTLFVGMPILLLAFNTAPPMAAPLANFLVVPIVSLLVVPVGVLGLLCSFFSEIVAEKLFILANEGLTFCEYLLIKIQVFSDNKKLAEGQPAFTTFQQLISIFAILLLLMRAKVPGYSYAICVWLLLFFPSDMFKNNHQKQLGEGDFLLTQLDVGQGSAVLISSHHHHWLYDTGGKFSPTFDAGKHIIAPFLLHYGIDELSGIIISHGDKDHAGGALSLAKQLKVKQWIAGGNAIELNLPTITTCQQQSWQADGLEFEFLHPLKSDPLKPKNHLKKLNHENDQSCVLQLRSSNHSSADVAALLLTGDISRSVEQQLVRIYGSRLRSETLFVPHHGSKTSSSSLLIDTVKPDRALVSSGFNNRYKHPHPDITSRYDKRQIQLLRSDALGAIQYLYRKGQWQGPFCHRYQSKHFWQYPTKSSVCIGALIKPWSI